LVHMTDFQILIEYVAGTFARMLVPKLVKNGFNFVLVVSAVFRVDRYS
jgi:hypothetical protein